MSAMMDIEKLKKIYADSEAVKSICDHLGRRERNQTETKLRRILRNFADDGIDLRKSEVIAGFRELAEAGCGKYVEGRHGWPSRFIWDVESLDVSDIAAGQPPAEAAPTETLPQRPQMNRN